MSIYFSFENRSVDNNIVIDHNMPNISMIKFRFFEEDQHNSFPSIKEIPKIGPIKPRHPARKGTAEKYFGYLNKKFPELEKISDERLMEILDELK